MMDLVIFCVAFSSLFLCSDKILTGSFDKTARIWSSETGQCLHILKGHKKEVVSFFCLLVIQSLLSFEPNFHNIGGSIYMDACYCMPLTSTPYCFSY